MTALQELIELGDRFVKSMDESIKNEKMFCDKILFELERMSWDSMRMVNDLKKIKDYHLGE